MHTADVAQALHSIIAVQHSRTLLHDDICMGRQADRHRYRGATSFKQTVPCAHAHIHAYAHTNTHTDDV